MCSMNFSMKDRNERVKSPDGNMAVCNTHSVLDYQCGPEWVPAAYLC